MELLILIVVSATTMLSNVAIAYLVYQMALKNKAEAKALEPPEKTPEELERERKEREKQALLEEGLRNMMDYTGAPMERGSFE